MLNPSGKRPSKSQAKAPGPTDRRRWFLHVGQQLTLEDIAQRENISVAKVQDSIDRCKEYRYRNSNENVALAINEQVLSLVPQIGKVFSDGLGAVKYLPQRNGRYKKVEDHTIRLKTVETIKSLQEVAQPKAPLIQQNTQFNNNINGATFAPGMSFEARLRRIREQRGLRNEDEPTNESASEVDDVQSVEDELGDIGVNLDDDDTEDGELVEDEG